MHELFVATDGDDVGSKTEYYMLTDQLDSLRFFSESFEAAFQSLLGALVSNMDAYIIFSGGDNFLAKIEGIEDYEQFQSDLRELVAKFQDQAGCSLSIGLGTSTTEAYLGLKLAKSSGKNRICLYNKGGITE